MGNEDINYKELDTKRIMSYMVESGRMTILVDDIVKYSGADKLRVYPVLFELEQSGFLEVTEREEFGAPTVVRKRYTSQV